MLHLLYGAAGTGKSVSIRAQIAALGVPDAPARKIFLLVPEQFSFETEREIYTALGAQASARVQVLSFTRLAELIFKTYGGMAGKTADDTKKLVFMELAAAEMRDTFEHYKRAAGYPSFAVRMLRMTEELKNAGILPEALLQSAAETGNERLLQKTRELCALCSAYQAILERSCVDPSDKLRRAAERVDGTPFFKDAVIFLDAFKSFTGSQMLLIRLMLRDAADCTVALCSDQTGDPLYAVPDDTAARLKRMARELGVSVAAPTVLTTARRFQSPALKAFAEGCFSPAPAPFDGENDAVRFVTAPSASAEVRALSAAICMLVREAGYRYREIAVIPAEMSAYLPLLQSELRAYEIPYYTDAAEGIRSTALIRFVTALLRLASGGLNTDSIFTLLKCGYAPFDEQQIAAFENYCLMWDLRGGAFRNRFTGNPNGFSETFGEAEAEQLAGFNAIREYLLDAVAGLRTTETRTAAQIGRALFDTLTALGVPEATERQIQSDATDLLTAQKLSRVWEILLEILDSMTVAAGDYPFTLARYAALFETACGQYTIGTTPQTLDAVTVGSMERIRLDGVRAVFVLGANKGKFPAAVPTGGVFSEPERKALEQTGLELGRPFEYQLAEQKFNAYRMLTMPAERLVVSAPQTDETGAPVLPSELFRTAEEIFSPSVLVKTDTLPPAFFCKTERTTFETYARCCRREDRQTASIRAALDGLPAYAHRLPEPEQAQNQSAARLTDQTKIDGLFPRRLSVSPSGLERFHQCKFRYFCANGLRVYPLRRATLDPMQTGSFLHDILESLASDASFVSDSEQTVRAKIGGLTDEYLERVLGGAADKTARFTYLYNRLRRTLLEIALHLQAELRQSEFTPADFELPIDADSEVKPLVLYAEDGTRVTVRGRIDRVDLARKNGKKYVRVIDYKSGQKTFRLTDVYYGLNLQMLVYLFCVWKNGGGKYKDVLPAGILYMPARGADNTRDRSDRSTVEAEKQKQYKMNGLLLNDEDALRAMEPGLGGVFIPAKMNKDGSFDRYSTLATLSELGKLYQYAEKLFTNMATALRAGEVEACPVEDKNGERFACAWCDYRTVCGISAEDAGRRMQEFQPNDFYQTIEEEGAYGAQLDDRPTARD